MREPTQVIFVFEQNYTQTSQPSFRRLFKNTNVITYNDNCCPYELIGIVLFNCHKCLSSKRRKRNLRRILWTTKAGNVT